MFVIGEIGVNWDGDFEIAREMMYESKRLGLNAVKFQSFTLDMVKSHPESNRLIHSSISKKNVEKIHQISQEIGIEWFSTPMFVEAIDVVEPYVHRYKIREFDGRSIVNNSSSDLFNLLYEKNKPIYISSENIPIHCKFYNEPNVKWLYCVPKYPCTLNEIDFSKFKYFDGFSNHCVDIEGPISAIKEGIEILEIHITSDKNKDFVDNNVSFDYDDLKDIMKATKSSIIRKRITHEQLS
jgi:sialic acid synthase SpsE